MRELAFRFSENDIRHWLILLAADRVNVGEGLLDDLAHGHVPNIFAEMGWRSEWRYNRAGVIKKALVAGVFPCPSSSTTRMEWSALSADSSGAI